MAAISNTMFAIVEQGKNVITSRHLFGNSYSLLTSTLKRLGVEAKLCDLTDVASVEAQIDENTCCLFLEIMTNPQLEVADVKALADIAHRHSIPVVADTTIIPFTQFSGKKLILRWCLVRSISVEGLHHWADLSSTMEHTQLSPTD